MFAVLTLMGIPQNLSKLLKWLHLIYLSHYSQGISDLLQSGYKSMDIRSLSLGKRDKTTVSPLALIICPDIHASCGVY